MKTAVLIPCLNEEEAYRAGFQAGNGVFNKFLGMILEKTFTDIFPGIVSFQEDL